MEDIGRYMRTTAEIRQSERERKGDREIDKESGKGSDPLVNVLWREPAEL